MSGRAWSIDARFIAQAPGVRGDAWLYCVLRDGQDWGVFVDRDIRRRTLFEVGAEVHPDRDEIIVQLSGRYWVRVGSWTRTLAPGEAALIPAGVEHDAGVATNLVGSHFLVLTFPRTAAVLDGVAPGGVKLPQGSAAWLEACLRMLRTEATQSRILPLTVLPEFLRSCVGQHALASDTAQPDATVAALLRMIEQPDTPTLAALARASGLSRAHLQRRFTAAVGHSPLQYANAWKLERIAEQLRNGSTLPLVELAANFGFGDQKHFRTLFRRRFGVSPSAYRTNPPP
jgi:AraC-like DNA-binding protein/mannose-6-phosphate isomerase-like protein (cupin superfamily)